MRALITKLRFLDFLNSFFKVFAFEKEKRSIVFLSRLVGRGGILLVFLSFLRVESGFSSTPSSSSLKNPLDISQGLPLEINSEDGIVCDKENNICTASGKVVAVQGDFKVTCDTMRAYFRKGNKEKSEVWKVEALGHVVLHSIAEQGRVWADYGVYTLEDERLLLTGKNLKLEAQGLEVRCQEALEYFKSQKILRAKGKAQAIKDGKRINGDTLTAYFREDNEKKETLWKMEGLGNVHIQAPDFQASAHQGVYTVEDGNARLEGGDLKMEMDHLTVRAKEALEYNKAQNIAFAKGDASAFKEGRLIKGKVLKAYFKPTASGKTELKEIEAFEEVLVSTKTEVATGDYGRYVKADDRATLEGKVKITGVEGQMEGDYAEVKLDTGRSKMLNHPSKPFQRKEGRVRVLLLPQSQKAS